MDTLKNVGVSAGVALLVVLGLMYLRPNAPVVVNNQQPSYGAAGNNTEGPCTTVNGNTVCKYHAALTTGTSTLATVMVPQNASSTILQAGCVLTGAATGTPQLQIWKGIGPQTHTTILGGDNFAATGTVVMATTTMNTSSALVGYANEFVSFASPNASLNQRMQGGCDITFQMY